MVTSSDRRDQSTLEVALTGDEAGSERRPEPSASATVGGRYKLGRRIGKGGMGEVMAARDVQIARDVAIKRMRAVAPSEKAIQRFLREAMVHQAFVVDRGARAVDRARARRQHRTFPRR